MVERTWSRDRAIEQAAVKAGMARDVKVGILASWDIPRRGVFHLVQVETCRSGMRRLFLVDEELSAKYLARVQYDGQLSARIPLYARQLWALANSSSSSEQTMPRRKARVALAVMRLRLLRLV